MGACQSDNSLRVTKEERQRTRQIDEELRKDKKKLESEIKLLLLGKLSSFSTFVKLHTSLSFYQRIADYHLSPPPSSSISH
jgi:hypothetical protein